jgi:UDP-N-acetylmuramoyl-tripeptide--D-alanyl-D-alanine ligase
MPSPVERVHTGLGLQLLYPLEGKLAGIEHLPSSLRGALRRALTAAAVRSSLRRCTQTRLVAVTGSVGKTTTKDLLGAMLSTAGPAMVTRANDNDVYGLPATLLLVRPRDRFAVIEAGAWSPGDMEWMASLFDPEVVVLTGIGLDHVRTMGTIEAVVREKQALLARLDRNGTAVVNADDDRAMEIAARLRCRVITAGSSPEAEMRIVSTTLDWPRGIEVVLEFDGKRHSARVPMLGEHRASQLALAAAAALALGIPLGSALEAAAEVPSRPGRLQPISGPAGSRLLIDDHKARPATVIAALETLRTAPAERRLAVLGECQDVSHTPQAYGAVAAAAARSADLVITVGRSGPALSPLLEGQVETLAAERPSEVASLLRSRLRDGDLALICAATRQHAGRAALRLGAGPVGCDVARCVFHWRCTDCPYLQEGPPPARIEAP